MAEFGGESEEEIERKKEEEQISFSNTQYQTN